MTDNKLRIVFMGTPEFAVGILDALIQNNCEVVGVITAADKPAGRGQKLKYSAVKEYALNHDLTLLQPTNLKDEQFLAELRALNANLQIVVAFRMLPKAVWEMPEYGTFNLHASLLPEYRGAAPINWAIINGETKTGVTTFFIDDKIDTGAMILKKETAIDPNENAGQLHNRLIELGKEVVIETVKQIENGSVLTTVQPQSEDIKTAHKLNKDNCKIDFTLPARAIHNLIRGLSPYPAAWCYINDGEHQWNVKLFEAEIIWTDHNEHIGQITAGKKELKIAITGAYLKVNSLQFPAKNKMTAAEFLNGMKLSDAANAS